MGMNRKHITLAIKAGLAGTIVMTVFTMALQVMGLPIHNLVEAVHKVTGGGPLAGWFGYFAAGTALALIYGQFFHHRLPFHGWRRGLVFGLVPWVIGGLFVSPMIFHTGFFMNSSAVALSALASYMAYGAVVGYLYR